MHILSLPSPQGVHDGRKAAVYDLPFIPMYYKDFDAWLSIKKHLNEEVRTQSIRAGEVRWVSFGVNIGSEIDGKGASFTRPALILSTTKSLALVVPLSSQLKEVAGYMSFELKGVEQSLCVHQMRIVSQKRIFSRLARISSSRLETIKCAVRLFFDL
jgi:mRNA interferase MazF